MTGFQIQSPAALEREADNRRALQRRRRWRAWAIALVALALLAWAFGYAQGYFDGAAGRGTVFQSKESN